MIKATELLPQLLLHQTKGDVEGISDLQIQIDFTDEWLADFDRTTHTRLQGRLTHVGGLYKPQHKGEDYYVFPTGCLDWFNRGTLKFRKRSEWFPKLISDLIFTRNLTGYSEMYVTIPKLFMKPEACPVILMWAHLHDYPVSDWIIEQAAYMTARYPDPLSTLSNKRRACRAWLLRRLVLTGQLEPDRFQAYRRV